VNVRSLVPDTLDRLVHREIKPRQAIRELVKAGDDEYFACEMVERVFGGGEDTIDSDEQGRPCYYGSRRLLSDVAKEIRNRNRARSRAERIDVVSHAGGSPERICSFWWSQAWGVTCDDAESLARLTAEGIATAPAGEIVFPRDGRKFFDALETHFSGNHLRAHRAATNPDRPISR